MKSTLGEPGLARSGRGHAGDDSPMVRPITPGNAVPGAYSLIAIAVLLGVATRCVGDRASRSTTAADSGARRSALDERAVPRHTCVLAFHERL